MKNLIKSEIRKLAYTRSFWWLIVGATALSALSAAASPYAISTVSDKTNNMLADANLVDSLYGKAVGGYLFVVILGVLIMAGEFRHGTAVATFLAAPKRVSVLLAKIITASLAGITMMFISTGVGLAAAKIALDFYPDSAAPHWEVFLNLTAVAFVSGIVLSLFGVAVGTLIRNQQIATLSVVIWMNVIERLITVFWADLGKWLPTGALTGMMALDLHFSSRKIGLSLNTADYLEPWAATLVLAGYGVVFSAIAIATSLRRDID